MTRSRICVFCGSSPGGRAAYAAAADALGRELGARGCTLVYGGAQVGLMGTVADGALAAGAEVVGVLPRSLMRSEIAHTGLTELHVTDDLLTRKQLMAELSDAFVALPGGLGTLDELFEMLTWAQLGVHDKPVGLLEPEDGSYWGALIEFLEHAVAERFLRQEHRDLLLVDTDPGRLLDRLAAVAPQPALGKWLDEVGRDGASTGEPAR